MRRSVTFSSQEEILHYSLSGLLDATSCVALNKLLGTISLLTNEQGPKLIAQQSVTAAEIALLLPLFSYYPDYCPLEVMHASYTRGNFGEEVIRMSRSSLALAKKEGVRDQELTSLRSTISRTRIKLQVFGLGIFSILELGYFLTSLNTHPSLQQNLIHTFTSGKSAV